ncbi:MAG: class I SAM-dependent methyltransferase [Candidatus Limnocylindrales bacterium]
MPFRAAFDCLWCGRHWETRTPEDLEGWAQLCADCLGSAGDNDFRRARLKAGLAERAGSAGRAVVAVAPPPGVPQGLERDDWYLRRGRFAEGHIDDTAWQMELDAATLWVDRLALSGEIVELAAGTGWWSPLLAGKGELWVYDASPESLDRARQRLVAHGLRAHLHPRDPWTEPDRTVHAVFCGVWLSQVPAERLVDFLTLVRRWLKPGGRFAFLDVSPGSARTPAALEAMLIAAGFEAASVMATARFFILGTAVARQPQSE